MRNIANKLCSGAVALAMLISAAPMAMAVNIPGSYEDVIGEAGVRTIDVKSNIQLAQTDSASNTTGNGWEEQKTVDLKNTSWYQFAYSAQIDMQPVRDAFDGYMALAEELAPLAGIDEAALNDVKVNGQFTIEVTIPAGVDVSGTPVSTGVAQADIMSHFTEIDYGSDVDFDDLENGTLATAPGIYSGNSWSYDAATGVLTIVVDVINANKTTLETGLKDFALVCRDLKVSDTGVYTIGGAISGSVTITGGDALGNVGLGKITYNFVQDQDVIHSYDEDKTGNANKLSATVKVNKTTSTGGGGGGAVAYVEAVIIVYNYDDVEIHRVKETGTAALDLTTLDLEELGLVKDGTIFGGWYADKGRKTAVVGPLVTTTSKKYLYPKYIPTGGFDIEFVVDGEKADVNTSEEGSVNVSEEDINVSEGELTIDIDNVDVEGVDTTGWYLDPECTIPFDPEKPLTLEDYPDGVVKIYTKTDGKPGDGPIKVFEDEDHFAYIIGYPDGTVRPEGHMTREEVTTMIYRLLTDEERALIYSKTNDFPDVADERWSNITISTMANGGQVKGYPDGEFKPENDITRAEFVTMLVRFFEYSSKGECSFEDVKGHWAEEYITIAQEHQWITGDNDTNFRPDDAITRAEVMTVMNRLLNRRVDFEGMLDVIENWVDNADDAWYYYEVLEATRSHEYERAEGELFETWTARKADRDWTAPEHHNAEY